MDYNRVATNENPHSPFDEELQPPNQFRDSVRDSIGNSVGTHPNSSYVSDQPINARDSANLNAPYPEQTDYPNHSSVLLEDKEALGVGAASGYPPSSPTQTKSSKKKWIIGGIIALIAIIVAVIVPVYFTVIKKNNDTVASESNNGSDSSNGGSGNGNGNGGGNTTTPASVYFYDGTTVTAEDGSTFVYKNKFGGYFVDDPSDPLNNGARAQSWSPALNETWNYGVDLIRGVNLGGWLNTEPFISPALFERYVNTSNPAIDEWTLSENMAADTANGGLNALEDHYKTFITEEDFAMIAGAGLNWVRLPIPYWAVEKAADEPFLEGVSWQYALKAFKWARKYGIRVNLDLHTVPGSQNGYNHSGKKGDINWMSGVMGLANAQRSLNIMRTITEFISQPEYSNVVPWFGIVNEARSEDIGMEQITSFYLHAYDTIRNISGIGEGKGPWMSVHDGFQQLVSWVDFLPGADRVTMDTHTYLCFTSVDARPLSQQLTKPCTAWSKKMNASMDAFGMSASGEWSLAINDCGLYLNGVGAGHRWDGTLNSYSGASGGSCEEWDDWTSWDDTRKSQLKQFALASMDALHNYFFWTWKIGNSSVTGKVEAPLWSYRLGLENGWMPEDPRESAGICGNTNPYGTLPSYNVGGSGAGNIAQSYRSQYVWPPASFNSPALEVASLPTYTATGSIVTMPPPTYTKSDGSGNFDVGDGWYDNDDTSGFYVPVQGCQYPDAWDAVNVNVPAPCTGGSRRRVRGVMPEPTPM